MVFVVVQLGQRKSGISKIGRVNEILHAQTFTQNKKTYSPYGNGRWLKTNHHPFAKLTTLQSRQLFATPASSPVQIR